MSDITSASQHLSEPQRDRLDALHSRYPATSFDVVEQDLYSRAATVEYSDAESCGLFLLTASGRTREV